MFNLTIKASKLSDLRFAMQRIGVGIQVEYSYVEKGIRIIDVAIAPEEEKFSAKVAKAAERFRY